MRHSFWNRRFPTPIGLIIIAVAIGVTTYLTRQPQSFGLTASSPLTIEDLRISNTTSAAVSISFRTDEKVAAQLRFGETLEGGTVLFDDREQLGSSTGLYKTHHFTATSFSPSQDYVFAILAKGVVLDNNKKGFTVKTAAKLPPKETEEDIEPIRGRVLDQNGSSIKDALVFVKIDGSVLLSTIVNQEGRFLIPLNGILVEDLTSYYTFTGSETIQVEVVDADGKSKIVSRPFTAHGQEILVSFGEEPASPPQSSGFQSTASPFASASINEPEIMLPKDGDFLIDQKPLFRGKGIPGQKVTLTIESDLQIAQVVVDANGIWTHQPNTPLAPGKHTVTATFFDGPDAAKIVTRSFEVFASGSQVSEPATPSSPIQQPTPPPSIAPTAAPVPKTATVLPAIAILSTALVFIAFGFLGLTKTFK